ncbi:MAG: hypothetical protein K2H43_06830, partial [Clostridia bacterium]|nr:hypothetical protein [Clostridia bacterium]
SVDKDGEIASVAYVEDNREGNNVLECLIYSGEENVTGNYEITGEYGTISITKRKAKIVTATLEKVYDGDPLCGDFRPDGTIVTGSAAIFENFVSDETYAATGKTVYDVQRNDAYNVFSVQNDTAYRFYTQREGVLRETTANYEIDYEYGTLKVTPRKLTVTTPSISRAYNGKPLLGTEGEATFEGLVSGESYEAQLVESIIDVGSKKNGTLYDNYTVRGGEKISTYWNYERTYRFGTLEITPREITVTTATLTKTYDGQYLYGDAQPNGTTVTGSAATFTDLAEGETPEAYNVTDLIDFGEKQNTTAYRFYAVRGGKTVETTDNYKVTREYGKLKIERREITVTTATLTKVYDGAALCGDAQPNGTGITGSAATLNNLAEGETYESYAVSELTDVAYRSSAVFGIDNETEYRIYTVRGDEKTETTGNYAITYVHGVLTVTPRPLVIHTAGDSWEYDGDPHQLLVGFFAENLLSGHSIVLDASRQSEFASVLDVADGKVVNRLYFNVTEAGADESRNAVVNGNYFAEREEFGTLEITPCELRVSTLSLKKTYDGDPLYGDGRNEADEVVRAFATSGLVKDDFVRADVENVSSLTDADTVENRTQYLVYALRGGAETDITANYAIAYHFGTLTVDRRKVTITTPTAERVYDASPYTETEGAQADGLVSGHILTP